MFLGVSFGLNYCSKMKKLSCVNNNSENGNNLIYIVVNLALLVLIRSFSLLALNTNNGLDSVGYSVASPRSAGRPFHSQTCVLFRCFIFLRCFKRFLTRRRAARQIEHKFQLPGPPLSTLGTSRRGQLQSWPNLNKCLLSCL